jgi:hypothetical protein
MPKTFVDPSSWRGAPMSTQHISAGRRPTDRVASAKGVMSCDVDVLRQPSTILFIALAMVIFTIGALLVGGIYLIRRRIKKQ